MSDLIQRLPSDRRISVQPTMVLGMNGTEFIAILGIAGITMLLLVCLTLPLFDGAHFSLLSGFVAAVTVSGILRAGLVNTKRQKPDGYVIQRMLKLRHAFSPIPGLVTHNGSWSLLRDPEEMPDRQERPSGGLS